MSGRTSSDSDLRGPTEALIARLTQDVRPVRRSWSPRSRFLLWVGFEVAVLLAALALLGVRPDLWSKLRGVLGPEVLLLLVVGVANALLALLAAVPGREPVSALAVGSLLGLAALIVIDARGPALAESGRTLAAGWACGTRTIAVALAPWLVLLLAVRRGATLVPARAGVFAAVAAFFVAAAVLRMVCPLDAREHVLVWHLGPVLLGVAASLLIGARWLALRARGRRL